MNIYRIQRITGVDYEEPYAAVVVAQNPREARDLLQAELPVDDIFTGPVHAWAAEAASCERICTYDGRAKRPFVVLDAHSGA